jgi:hypothetical protein
MTDLQNAMLKEIARSDYTAVNGKEPECVDDIGEVWVNVVIRTAEDKGVFTSLINAGLAVHLPDPEHRADSTLSLTQAGFDAYKAIIQ